MEDLTITPEAADSAVALELVASLGVDLVERYGIADEGFGPLDPSVVAPGGVFLVARLGPRPVGCAALLRVDDRTAEVKRVFATLGARGTGVGTALMVELERQGRRLGYAVLRLETGDRQPEAVALYERCGYEPIPCWGRYAERGWSICMAKTLD